jgi:hypothetical protein
LVELNEGEKKIVEPEYFFLCELSSCLQQYKWKPTTFSEGALHYVTPRPCIHIKYPDHIYMWHGLGTNELSPRSSIISLVEEGRAYIYIDVLSPALSQGVN